MRVATVTLNASLDKVLILDSLAVGEKQTARVVYPRAGGKGLNVASVLRCLNHPVTGTGFLAGHQGAFVRDDLAARGIGDAFLEVEGESRVCLTLLSGGEPETVTEILEPGPVVHLKDIQRIGRAVAQLARTHDVVAFSGSAPPGSPDDVYERLIRIAQAEGAHTFLDTSKAFLRYGLRAGPTLIRINQTELSELTEAPVSLDSVTEIIEEMGIGTSPKSNPIWVVSFGPDGAILRYHEGAWWAKPPQVNARNPVSCGDAMMAGLLVGFGKGWPWEKSLRYSVAVSAAKAIEAEVGFVRPGEVERLLPGVRVMRL